MTEQNQKSGGTDKRQLVSGASNATQHTMEFYQVIVHCRDEAQQRELFDRLRDEGFRCRLTVL
jgi:hypothetical protein